VFRNCFCVKHTSLCFVDPLLTFGQLAASYPRHNKLIFDKRPLSWFPLYPSPPLAGLVADLMADGHLQGPQKWRLDYCSNSLAELNRFENVLNCLFGLKGKIRDCPTNKYGTKNYGVNCRPLAKTLFLIGVPYGNKVLKDYQVPAWVISDKTCFASFCRRYFDCEAGVDVKGRAISIELHKSTKLIRSSNVFLGQIRGGLLDYFGIKATRPFQLSLKIKRKCGAVVQGTRMKIKGKENLAKFYRSIKFDNPRKMQNLASAIT